MVELESELEQFKSYKSELETLSTEITQLRECKVELEKLRSKSKSQEKQLKETERWDQAETLFEFFKFKFLNYF